MRKTLRLKTGETVEVIRPGTRDGTPALTLRADGSTIEVYYNDMAPWPFQGWVFYGQHERLANQSRRLTQVLRDQRRDAGKTARVVPASEWDDIAKRHREAEEWRAVPHG